MIIIIDHNRLFDCFGKLIGFKLIGSLYINIIDHFPNNHKVLKFIFLVSDVWHAYLVFINHNQTTISELIMYISVKQKNGTHQTSYLIRWYNSNMRVNDHTFLTIRIWCQFFTFGDVKRCWWNSLASKLLRHKNHQKSFNVTRISLVKSPFCGVLNPLTHAQRTSLHYCITFIILHHHFTYPLFSAENSHH